MLLFRIIINTVITSTASLFVRDGIWTYKVAPIRTDEPTAFEKQGTGQNRFAILARTEVQGDAQQEDDQQEDVAVQIYKQKSSKKKPKIKMIKNQLVKIQINHCLFYHWH